MIKKIFLFLFFFSYSALSYAQDNITNVGFSAFNITAKRFNCIGFKNSTEGLKEIHISFLYNTFGNDFTCLKELLKDSRFKTLQIHLINEPGHRNRRLGRYEFLYNISSPRRYNYLIEKRGSSIKQKYFSYLRPLINFLEYNLRPDVQLLISPGLESNISSKSGKILIQWTRELFPNARIVWNPLIATPAKRVATNADFIEGHGLFPNIKAPCIFNLDGVDISYENRPAIGEKQYTEGMSKNWVQSGYPVFQLYEDFSNRCEYAFIWVAESNGINYKSLKFVDPRLRNNRISTARYKEIFNDIKKLQARGIIYPSQYVYSEDDNFIASSCNKIYSSFKDGFKRGFLLKQSEFRNRGAVLILPKNLNSITSAKLYKGKKVVDKFTKVGRYKDGRILYRSSKSPTFYPLNTYLVLNKKNNKICYKIQNPRIRLD